MPVLMRENGIDDSTAELWRLWMRALRDTQPRLLAYLSYMAERLLIMSRILKPTGSLYFHCDPTVSHYVKPLLDAVFGHGNFRNEVIWRRASAHSSAKRWAPVHDTLLYYSKSDYYQWNSMYEDYDQTYIEGHYRYSDEHGRFRDNSLTGPGIPARRIGSALEGYRPNRERAALGGTYHSNSSAALSTTHELLSNDSTRTIRHAGRSRSDILATTW